VDPVPGTVGEGGTYGGNGQGCSLEISKMTPKKTFFDEGVYPFYTTRVLSRFSCLPALAKLNYN